MKLRRFNDAGLDRMNAFLDTAGSPSSSGLPGDIITDDSLTELLPQGVEVSHRDFETRFAAGEYLNGVLGNSGLEHLELDRGLWAWLAMFYFEQLAPLQEGGHRKLGERARWIPAVGDFRKYYRHLLAGPYRIYRAHRDHPDRARVLLANPLHSPGEPAEQIAAYQELVTNAAIVEAATVLYVNSKTGKYKRGASGKVNGVPRRFAEVLNQFDLTWDLYAMSCDGILSLMPPEFDRFRSANITDKADG